MEQKQFRLYWLGGKTEVIEGKDYPDACKKAGLGVKALSVLDFYIEGSEKNYAWDSKRKMWTNSIQTAIRNNMAFDNNTEI